MKMVKVWDLSLWNVERWITVIQSPAVRDYGMYATMASMLRTASTAYELTAGDAKTTHRYNTVHKWAQDSVKKPER